MKSIVTGFEKYTQITDSAELYVKPQKSVTFSFENDGIQDADRLFFTGETDCFYFWKSEPDYQMLYRRIDDALNSEKSQKNRFCLDFSGKSVSYPKIAFKKLVTPFMLSYRKLEGFDNVWRFGVSACADNLKIEGYLRVTLEVRYIKEGVSKYSTVPEPDSVFTIDIDEGSYGFCEYSKTIELDSKNIANICYYVEGERYAGEVYFEQPHFCDSKNRNILPQFAPHSADRAGFDWMGQNLSHIEWTDMCIEINGKLVFDGSIFERCHRFSEAEITLPRGILKKGENTITFKNTSRYRDAAGYNIKEIGFIENIHGFVVSVPRYITAKKPFFVAVEGERGKNIEFYSQHISPYGGLTLTDDGLNILSFVCDTPMSDISFTLNGEQCKISRCVQKSDDGVLTGTGDMVYIDANPTSHKNYLKWYLSNGIGNLLTIRPTYRWCGTREPDDTLWQRTAKILEKAGIKYAHMLDGRELCGCNCNPTQSTLETPLFLGRQTHEFDGMFCYWKNRDVTDSISQQMFYDLFLRMFKANSDRMNYRYIPQNIHYSDKQQQLFRPLGTPMDMECAANALVKSIKDSRLGAPRHTGPSTLFKYFYQAGYDFLGAELMYTPTELTLASLRGAKNSYGKDKIGAHLAVQWSTAPHDSDDRMRRYLLALFTSYILGVDEINTEEGLWRLEEYYSYFNRFSPACIGHTKIQQRFYDYVSTHTRTGRFYTPIAFVSGRYDGWMCFSRKSDTFGVDGFGFEAPEKAWDLLTFFYPNSVLNSHNYYDCPQRPIGYYSGTPYGNVDIVPIEADGFTDYRLLVACGYNAATACDMKKLSDFVESGGTLVIGWAQLSTTTERTKAVNIDHEYILNGDFSFVADTLNGEAVTVCDGIGYDRVILYTDNGRPLVTVKTINDGKVYFINAKEYASNAAVDKAFRKALRHATEDCISEQDIFAVGDDRVQFSIFDNDDGSKNIYFITTDWYSDNRDGKATLVLGSNRYSVPVPFGSIVKVRATENVAVFPLCDENEVMMLTDDSATVQGRGNAQFVICKNGETKTVTVDFTDNAVKTIKI